MNSQILGSVDFQYEPLQKEIALVEAFPMHPAYGEYAAGKWGTCMLWNKTGRASDGFSVEYEGCAVATELGRQISYLNSIMSQTFDLNYLKSARIFEASSGGMIIPHCDYIEFDKGFSRLHIPLRTDMACFNSEEDTVFHMNEGEIWYLDGRLPHSGGCFSEISRLHLVMDFDPNVPLPGLFKDRSAFNPNLPPTLIQRDPMTAEDIATVRNLSNLISPTTYKDVVGLIAKIHFQRKVSCSEMYKWLIEISAASRFPQLVEQSRQMRLKFLGCRQ